MTKPRLAIVSTFDDLCGIAGYTRFLIKQIEGDFDVDVFDLDQFFMRSGDKSVRRLADEMIMEFCAKAGTYDFVNIQLEHGTLGRKRGDIVRRFRWIAQAAPALSVTFHTILRPELEAYLVTKALSRFNLFKAVSVVGRHFNVKFMNKRIYGLLRREARKKPVNVIVHTRRDMRVMRYVNRLPAVFDHPLCFLRDKDIAEIRASGAQTASPQLKSLPPDAKTIGVFGFLSEYKGFETMIRAMHHLPENYHLLFFGGLHPNEIKKEEKINPYVNKLLREAFVDRSIFDVYEKTSLNFTISDKNLSFLLDHPKDIGHRLHFLGAQTDEGFARAMAYCDVVVLPYLEVGQSSSGPMSMAIEMGARIIAARNLAFMQFARYFPETIEFFEIGNHLELAQRIASAPEFPAESRRRPYNAESNRALYLAANSRIPPETARSRTEPAPSMKMARESL
ncbi:hypothetical protein K9U39_18550 [Rhodoblastus acidophilus]|uniref:Glycosyltransferase n=1 Tax=Candidatus Rhodoblastus alkanivorans TaxID=2954117 RepID=A0ABS9Z2H4_9HYPH|nr:hypothetical protein [Candidatus Rhodoblastus alkanivorans]MCI4677500.1 hypothetical protein [Candidatus Rhodoblastus alkanivorans]MCI4681859.1 hypothetical protein [Candidatus Rhodoblastus alkanivorans]MDI4642909.1 hypothetical protein [Rhodoblastus acidophilus]